MALGSTQPLTEMSTGSISWRGKDGRCVRLTTLPPSCAVVTKSGNLNWSPLGLSRPVMGLLYLHLFTVSSRDGVATERYRDRIPVLCEISSPVQTYPGTHLPFVKLVMALFSSDKVVRRCRKHPPSPSPEVKERVCTTISETMFTSVEERVQHPITIL